MAMIGNRDWKTAVGLLAVLALATCGGDKKPSTPTQPTTEPTTTTPPP